MVLTLDLPTTERYVRAMLRRARNLERLSNLPVVAPLCSALDEENPIAMVRLLAESSFGPNPGDRQLYDLVRACDLDATMTQEGLSIQYGLSRRQFFRRRAVAVRAISHRVRELLRGVDLSAQPPRGADALVASVLSETEPSSILRLYPVLDVQTKQRHTSALFRARLDAGEYIPLASALDAPREHRAVALALAAQSQTMAGEDTESAATLSELRTMLYDPGDDDNEVRFELEVLNFLRARIRGYVHGMRSAAERMRRLAPPRTRLSTRAERAMVETELSEGRGEDARRDAQALETIALQSSDLRSVAWCRMFDALLGLRSGSVEDAETAALLADVALSHVHPDASIARSVTGEISLRTHHPWSASDIVASRPRFAWDRTLVLVWVARHLLEERDFARAEAIAEEALTIASVREYNSVAGLAAATLGAGLDARGATDAAQRWYRHALSVSAANGNVLDAMHMFAIPGLPQREFGPFEDVRMVATALAERIDIAYPLEVGGIPGSDPALCAYLEALLRFARGDGLSVLMAATAAFKQSAPPRFAQFVRNAAEITSIVLLGSTMVLVESERTEFAHQLRVALQLSGVAEPSMPIAR
jgi:hypothetical protein